MFYRGGSGISRYRPSGTVAPCVGEEGVAVAGGGRTGVNAGGEDIGESVDLSSAEPCCLG